MLCFHTVQEVSCFVVSLSAVYTARIDNLVDHVFRNVCLRKCVGNSDTLTNYRLASTRRRRKAVEKENPVFSQHFHFNGRNYDI